MNSESTDQVQGQESASIQDTTILQNQLLDTSNIQLQKSAVDKITQNCTSDEVENLTSSIQISDSQESSETKASNEAHKSLITNLYKVLVCEKLPATDESSSLSVITNKIFLTPDIKENETFNQRIEEFIEILEVLSEPCGCDKIGSNDCAEIEEMTKSVRLKIEKIKVDKSRLTLLIKEDKLDTIVQKYENLKADEVLMKVLFHKSYSIGNSNNEIFKKLKNYQSINQKFILKDLCDTFERTIVPKTQTLLSLIKTENNSTWNTLDNSIKSAILKSYVDFQRFYISLQELIHNNSEHLNSLSHQQIVDIIQNGFTKVSKIEQLSVPSYILRTFTSKDKMYSFRDEVKRKFFDGRIIKFHDLQQELSTTKTLIIADNFGTGKTTTLKYFARKLKEDDNKLWISYINAQSLSSIFERIQKILSWNVEVLADFLVRILRLSGIEVPIFKQKFVDNQVVLLWDHIDGKYQQTLIDFAAHIKEQTQNQQVFALQLRYSANLEQKFNKVSYKLIPLTSTEIRNFHHNTEDSLDHEKLLKFCEYIELRVKVLTKVGKIFVMENILLFGLIVQAFVDLKIELDCKVDVFSILDSIYKKQLLAYPQKLTEDDKIMLLKFLQVHALKSMFGNELTKSLEALQTYEASQPPITSLNGIFSVNFHDNSIDFHSQIIAEYFVTKFIMDNVFNARTKDITVKESKIIVKILALIIPNNQRLLNQINDAIQLQYKNPSAVNKVQESIFKVIRKAQYWSIATDVFNRPLKFIDTLDNGKIFIISDWEFWERFYTNIGYQDEKDEAKAAMQSVEKKPKKKSKEIVDRPTVKGVISSKKLSYNHDISNQFDDFTEDY